MGRVLSEDEIQAVFDASVARHGIYQTHELHCATWREKNWTGACDCWLKSMRACSKCGGFFPDSEVEFHESTCGGGA